VSELPDGYDDVPPSSSVDMPPGDAAARPTAVRPALGATDPAEPVRAAGTPGDPPDRQPGSGPTAGHAAEDAADAPAAAEPAPGPGIEPVAGRDAGGPTGGPMGGPMGGPTAGGAEPAELADPGRLRAAVEAVLLVVDVPTSPTVLAQVLGRSVPEVEEALRTLREEYDSGGRGLDLREVAEGWRLYSRDDFAAYVERFVLDGQQARLTQAALETLAVVAYRQPVTRSRVSAIRGVSVDAVMRTLLTRGLVEECGADPDTGGGLYRTTRLFLEKLGLRSLEELPSLAPLLPDTSQLDDVAVST
jgi:segregation and condensation protein B